MAPFLVASIVTAVLRATVGPSLERASTERRRREDADRRRETRCIDEANRVAEAGKAERERDEAQRRLNRAQAITLPVTEAKSPREEDMDERHSLVCVGIDAAKARNRMGEPGTVATLGRRELWNYALGGSPARWQVLIEDGKVIGTYVKGTYRFASTG